MNAVFPNAKVRGWVTTNQLRNDYPQARVAQVFEAPDGTRVFLVEDEPCSKRHSIYFDQTGNLSLIEAPSDKFKRERFHLF